MKLSTGWYSQRLEQNIAVVRWGHYGLPVLLFPTAGGDAEECERFLMIKVLTPLLEAGRIKVYACDNVAGRTWLSGEHSGRHRAWVQNQFHAFVYRELLPAIRQDCDDAGIEVVTAGASIGAFQAVSVLCRFPDAFRMAVGMSGTYDLSRWLAGDWSDDFYYSSPLHFVPELEGEQLESLRRRHVLLATGEGRWEDPGQSWRLASVLGAKGIPNRVDAWGPEYDHDWMTWRDMLPRYLEQIT